MMVYGGEYIYYPPEYPPRAQLKARRHLVEFRARFKGYGHPEKYWNQFGGGFKVASVAQCAANCRKAKEMGCRLTRNQCQINGFHYTFTHKMDINGIMDLYHECTCYSSAKGFTSRKPDAVYYT